MHKTPFSRSCLSSYSHFSFNCEHTKDLSALTTQSFPTVDLLNPFLRCLVSSSLPGVGIRTSSLQCKDAVSVYCSITICNSITQIHFSFEILSSFGLLLCPQCVSSKLLKQFFTVSFKGSASFPHRVRGNLNAPVLAYLLFLSLPLCSITYKYTCSYHFIGS